MRLTIVTVDCNRHADTLACVDSLFKSSCRDFDLVVVDNGSDEPLLSIWQESNIELIRLESNGGFAAGFNVGIRRALDKGAEAVLILNNDTVVAQAMLALLVNELGPGVGIVAPRIYYMDDPHRIWSDGFMAHPLTLEMREGQRGKLEGQVDAPPIRQVDYVLGCAMLVDRKVFEQVGLFDEGFFAYYEDLDYCIRARKAGFRIATIPTAHLWHKVASTTGLTSPRRQYLMAYGSIRFFAKHAGWRWPLVAAMRLASFCKTVVSLVLARRGDLIASHVRGIWNGWRDAFSN
jgi:GT2 family glycosyltransferase